MESEIKPPVNLYKKILAISDEMGRLPKSGYNNYHKYAYVTEADAMDRLRGLCVKHGVVIIPTLIGQQRVNGDLTCVEVSYTIADAVTGETVTCVVPGQGKDSGDKGVYKALTGSFKYFILKTYLVPTGDDPERDEASAKQTSKPIAKSQPAVISSIDEPWNDEHGKPLIEAAPTLAKNAQGKIIAKAEAVKQEIVDLLIDLAGSNAKDIGDTLEMVSEWRDKTTNKVNKAGIRDVAQINYTPHLKSKKGWSDGDFILDNLRNLESSGEFKDILTNWRTS